MTRSSTVVGSLPERRERERYCVCVIESICAIVCLLTQISPSPLSSSTKSKFPWQGSNLPIRWTDCTVWPQRTAIVKNGGLQPPYKLYLMFDPSFLSVSRFPLPPLFAIPSFCLGLFISLNSLSLCFFSHSTFPLSCTLPFTLSHLFLFSLPSLPSVLL